MIDPLTRHPASKPALLFILACLAVIVFVIWGQNRFEKNLAELEDLQRRVQFSQTGPVAPSAAVREALSLATGQLERLNAALDAKLFPTGEEETLGAFSGNSTAAYFEIAAFVESMSQAFQNLDIAIPDKTRFGFSEFAQKGPDPAILDRVMTQKAVIEKLLQPLLVARPLALTAIKREYLRVENEEPTMLQQAAGTRNEPRIRLVDTIPGGEKVEGFESYSVELAFEGYSESLRRYLKELLSGSLPVVITGLEVVPLDRFGSEEKAAEASESSNPFAALATASESKPEAGPVPIIRNNLSSFRLSLEVYCGSEAAPEA